MLVTIVSGVGEVLQSRFLLVKVVKGLIPLILEGKSLTMDVSLSQGQIIFAPFIFLLNFSSYFL